MRKDLKNIHKLLMSQSGIKTSEDWFNFIRYCGYNIILLDPRGWDQNNFVWSYELEKINNFEFYERLRKSKITWN